MPRKDIFLVAAQFVLFGFIFFLDGSRMSLFFMQSIAGKVLMGIGFFISVLALLQLNTNLSPFPTPKKGSQLVDRGLYSVVRHPIYLGLVIFFVGYSFYYFDWLKLGLTIILYLLFEYKSAYEEKLLEGKFPEYISYKKRTGKIFPFI